MIAFLSVETPLQPHVVKEKTILDVIDCYYVFLRFGFWVQFLGRHVHLVLVVIQILSACHNFILAGVVIVFHIPHV